MKDEMKRTLYPLITVLVIITICLVCGWIAYTGSPRSQNYKYYMQMPASPGDVILLKTGDTGVVANLKGYSYLVRFKGAHDLKYVSPAEVVKILESNK